MCLNNGEISDVTQSPRTDGGSRREHQKNNRFPVFAPVPPVSADVKSAASKDDTGEAASERP